MATFAAGEKITADKLNEGRTWQTYAVAWTAVTTNPSIGNGTLEGRYMQYGKLVVCEIGFAAGSTTNFGSGSWRFSVPLAATSQTYRRWPCTILGRDGTVNYGGIGFLSSGIIIPASADGTGTQWSSAAPFAWASGDEFHLQLTYEAD